MTASYSRVSLFEKCPQQYEYKYIQKLREPKSEALANGNARHDECERYLKGEIKRIPKTLVKIGPQLKRLKSLNALAEEWWNFDNKWNWQTKPFQWLVAKADAYCAPLPDMIEITDFKTGKKYPEHKKQLHLYATCALSMFECSSVIARADYVDLGESLVMEWGSDNLPAMQKSWNIRIARLEKAKTYKKNPGFYCKWCSFNTSKGGPCTG